MKNNRGQNTIEYILIFATVVVILLLALGPGGFITKSINKTVELSVDAIDAMARDINYDNGN